MKSTVGRKAKTECINISELENWIKADLNRLASIKCQALISLKKNVKVKDICKVLGVSRESVRTWRIRVENEGPDGFIKHPKTGRKSGLTDEIKEFLKVAVTQPTGKYNYKQAVWDGKLVCRLLEEKKGIEISVRTAQNWLHKIGLSRQKPRKKYKQGDDVEIKTFKKNPKRNVSTKRK